MSLSKQLLSGIWLILSLVFVLTLWFNVSNTREYINAQLASHAQDTATSLGLSVAPYMGETPDLALIDTMFNAIFDRGYYQSLVLSDNQGTPFLSKRNSGKPQQIPNWFINLFPLTPPQADTDINSGWNLVGTLSITSHPGIGYQQLWHRAVQSFWMTLGLFVVAGLMVSFVMKVITRPIQAVVTQAKDISEGRFVQIESVPRTTELRTLVQALNVMSKILAKLFSQLSDQAEKYRQYAYVDPLTQLGNRRAFDLHFERLLSDKEKQAEGYLLIVRMSSLHAINQISGAQEGDNYIATLVKATVQHCAPIAHQCKTYRVGGADLALILENMGPAETGLLCNELNDLYQSLTLESHRDGTAHMGAGHFQAGSVKHQVLEQADSALAVAAKLKRRWQLAEMLEVNQSNAQWREQITQILERQQVSFAAQPIKSPQGKPLYQECFARFSLSDDQVLPVGQLIPASERLNYAQAIDQLVVSHALKKLQDREGDIGVNITPLSVADDGFCHWLVQQLGIHHALCHRLVIEISEHCIGHSSQNLLALSKEFKRLGVRLTLEHFGASMAPFAYIRQVAPHYIKLDGSFVRDIENQPDNRFFVQSLVNIAHGLNIEVIAEMVETAAEANTLQGLFVDHLQGYFIAQPSTW